MDTPHGHWCVKLIFPFWSISILPFSISPFSVPFSIFPFFIFPFLGPFPFFHFPFSHFSIPHFPIFCPPTTHPVSLQNCVINQVCYIWSAQYSLRLNATKRLRCTYSLTCHCHDKRAVHAQCNLQPQQRQSLMLPIKLCRYLCFLLVRWSLV